MVTLKDIARKAGVSSMTVSNVINGNKSKVSKATLERVLALVEEFHYVPNLNARSLAKRSTHTVVVFVSTFVSHENVFRDPYLAEFFGEIEGALRSNGYYVLVQTVDALHHAATILQNWNADGAIFLSPIHADQIKQIRQHAICPIVFIDSYDSIPGTLEVGINEFKGGYIATKYLLACGHRRIAIAGFYSENSKVVQDRYEGYLAALREYGITEESAQVIHTATTYEAGVYLGGAVANREYDVTAIFATADLLAIGIIEGARRNGCMVPKDLSVIGFDNISLCHVVTPKLTSVSQNLRDKARAAVELLLRAIQKDDAALEPVICDVQLEIRQSVQDIGGSR